MGKKGGSRRKGWAKAETGAGYVRNKARDMIRGAFYKRF